MLTGRAILACCCYGRAAQTVLVPGEAWVRCPDAAGVFDLDPPWPCGRAGDIVADVLAARAAVDAQPALGGAGGLGEPQPLQAPPIVAGDGPAAAGGVDAPAAAGAGGAGGRADDDPSVGHARQRRRDQI